MVFKLIKCYSVVFILIQEALKSLKHQCFSMLIIIGPLSQKYIHFRKNWNGLFLIKLERYKKTDC